MKKSLLLLLPVILFACVSVVKRRPAQYSVAEMNPQAKFRHPKLDFQTFLGRIKASRAATVAEALEALHKTHSAYMTVHTLVYDSLSLQEASFLEPRAVVFGPEADFIFTFNGGTHQRGGYGIETMQFNPVTSEFEFREIEFKKELAADEQEDLPHEDVDFEDARIKVSKKNPTRCTQCHGTPPQPNWDTYYFWPGVYGSNDDLLTSLFDRSEVASNPNYEGFGLDKIFGHSQGRTLKLADGAVDREVEGFKKHIATRSQHPRFRWLPLRAIDQAYVRWNAGEEKEKIDTSPAIKAEFAYLGLSYPAHRPNLHLTDLLYARTAPKAAKAIKAISPRMPLQMAYLNSCAYQRFEGYTPDRFVNEKDILALFSDILTPQETAKIHSASGEWKAFLLRYLFEELGMESEKISRFANTFGAGALVPTENDGPRMNLGDRPPYDFYARFTKRMPQYARYVTEREAEGVFTEAVRNYIANGLGLKLENFAVNLRRIPTFREDGFGSYVNPELYGGALPKSTNIRDNDCAELLSRLTRR